MVEKKEPGIRQDEWVPHGRWLEKTYLVVVMQGADADPGQVGKLFYGIRRLYWLHWLASSVIDGDSKLLRGVRVKGEFW